MIEHAAPHPRPQLAVAAMQRRTAAALRADADRVAGRLMATGFPGAADACRREAELQIELVQSFKPSDLRRWFATDAVQCMRLETVGCQRGWRPPATSERDFVRRPCDPHVEIRKLPLVRYASTDLPDSPDDALDSGTDLTRAPRRGPKTGAKTWI